MTLHRIEIYRGPQPKSVPPILKHAVRLGRRLRQHRIWPVVFPAFVEGETTHITVRAGNRALVLDNSGACRASLKPYDDGNERIVDPQSHHSHYNRTHAMWLTFAAEDRKRGWTRVARGHVGIAKADRHILQEAP